MTRDVTASIKARLLNRARQEDGEFELFLVRYACERFLYRLGVSPLRERCILKGAGLLTVWMHDPYRATRDVDLLASGASDEASIREIVKTVCAMPCPEDGLVFDLESLSILPIRSEEEYQGQRALLRARLGKARIRVQVDFGFGDAVVPPAEEADYPTLLEDLPAPRLRIYPQVVTVAEKFQAMVDLGRRNSRMKDFHDIWALSSEFEFDGGALREAVTACFERRRMIWTAEAPDALRAAFYSDSSLAARGNAHLRAGAFRTSPPADFKAVGERVREFLGPVRKSILAGEGFERSWPPGGSWQ